MREHVLRLRAAAGDEAADADRRAAGGQVGLAGGVARGELGAHHALPLGGVLDARSALRRLLHAGPVTPGGALQRLVRELGLRGLLLPVLVDLLGQLRRAFQLPQHAHGAQR